MTTYVFETITAAQALAFQPGDALSFNDGALTAQGVSVAFIAAVGINPAHVDVTADGVTKSFGETFQLHPTFLAQNSVLVVGSPGGDDLAGVDGKSTTIYAGGGADTITAGFLSSDVIHGGDGDDLFNGSTPQGHWTVFGDAGDDTISSWANGAVLDGGAGHDALKLVTPTFEGMVVNLATGLAHDSLGTDTISGFEVVIGGNYSDTLTGTAGADTLIGGGWSDLLDGGAGDDSLDGGAGYDFDTVTYANANGSITVSLANTGPQAIGGGYGVDTLRNIENVIGGAFNDSLSGDGWGNLLSGGGGDDTIHGGEAALGAYGDTLHGDAGSDLLTGGVASASLFGDAGDDTLIGGTAKDALDGGDGMTSCRATA